MSYCTNCGTRLRDGAKFCPSCGEKVDLPEAPASTPTPMPVQEKIQPQSQPRVNEIVCNAAATPGEVVLSTWENSDTQPTQQSQPQNAGPVREHPQKKKKSHGCLWAILIVLAIVAVFFVYDYYLM